MRKYRLGKVQINMEVQIIASSEEESAFIRQSLQEYNARYMQDLSEDRKSTRLNSSHE